MDDAALKFVALCAIKLHGDKASSFVMQCMDEALEYGSEYNFNFWNGVLRAVEEWERQGRKPAH